MLVSARAMSRDGTEGRSTQLRSDEGGRRWHHNESLSGDPPGALLGHPQRGSRGRQLLGIRHRDGWQELLSGTTLTVSRPGSVRGLETSVTTGAAVSWLKGALTAVPWPLSSRSRSTLGG
jgi:hypothetical protein